MSKVRAAESIRWSYRGESRKVRSVALVSRCVKICAGVAALVVLFSVCACPADQPEPERSVTVTRPRAGEVLIAGTTYRYYWQTLNIGSGLSEMFTVEYSINGGSTWVAFAGVSNDGSDPWSIPANINSDRCMLRITSRNYPEVSDVSAMFSIHQPEPDRSVTVTRPRTGEVLIPFEFQVRGGITLGIEGTEECAISVHAISIDNGITLSHAQVDPSGLWQLGFQEPVLSVVLVAVTPCLPEALWITTVELQTPGSFHDLGDPFTSFEGLSSDACEAKHLLELCGCIPVAASFDEFVDSVISLVRLGESTLWTLPQF